MGLKHSARPERGKVAMFGTGKLREPAARPYELTQQLMVGSRGVKEARFERSAAVTTW